MRGINRWKRYVSMIAVLICILCGSVLAVHADVGNFNDYTGGDFDFDFGGTGSDSDFLSGWFFAMLFQEPVIGIPVLIVFVIFFIVIFTKKKKHNKQTGTNLPPIVRYGNQSAPVNRNQEAEQYFSRLGDVGFSSEKFCSFAEHVFVKMQDAWSQRDWKLIRPFESDTLFAKHNSQLEWYIRNGQINKMDRVCVNRSYICNVFSTDSDDVLEVFIDAKFSDYIIEEGTGKLLKGNPDTTTYMKYKMTFVRSTGIKTGELINDTGVLTCPNCMANVDITASGKCEYCDTVIISKQNNWVLNDLDQYR